MPARPYTLKGHLRHGGAILEHLQSRYLYINGLREKWKQDADPLKATAATIALKGGQSNLLEDAYDALLKISCGFYPYEDENLVGLTKGELGDDERVWDALYSVMSDLESPRDLVSASWMFADIVSKAPHSEGFNRFLYGKRQMNSPWSDEFVPERGSALLMEMFKKSEGLISMLNDSEDIPLFNIEFSGEYGVIAPGKNVLIGNTLIEVNPKTSFHALDRKSILHLLGNALLDLDDSYGIENVAIFHARSGQYQSWDLESLLRVLTGDNAATVNGERKRLVPVLDQARWDREKKDREDQEELRRLRGGGTI